MRLSKVVTWTLFFFIAVQGSLGAQAENTPKLQQSCRDFVQGFYDWYVPKSQKETDTPSWALALKDKRSAFSPELARLLREDADAQAKATGEIVGLDFDPFLFSQDPDERYVAKNVTLKGNHYWVEVHAVRSGKTSDNPVLVPELILRNGQWFFSNFHYGRSEPSQHENLLTVLKSLEEGRQKQPR
jgi:hypothetical protein